MNNQTEFKFGDYAIIEQKRHGAPNEMFFHKVIDQLRSNTWVDVPVQSPATETMHDEMEDVCLCICCGVDQTKVRRYRVKDMRHCSPVSAVTDEKKGSTITLQAVNELIASLENAGELSIREQKFLKLAKAFKQLAAENLTMNRLLTDISDNHVEYFSEGEDGMFAGVPLDYVSEINMYVSRDVNAENPFPATDAYLAGIKADGVEEWVSSRGGRWNGTTEEALKFAKQLLEGKSEEVKS